MFGHKHEWIKVKGVVVAADRQEAQFSDGAPVQTVGGYVVDVTPEGVEPFRARVWPGGFNVPGLHAESSHFQHPGEGQTVALEYNPKHHEVRFDMDDPSNFKPGMACVTAVHVVDLGGSGAGAAALGGHPGAAGDPVQRLTKLAKLKEVGLVNDAQFAELKAKILGEF